MKQNYCTILALISVAVLSSCFKKEPLNSEADILRVSVHVENPLGLFINEEDTAQDVLYDVPNNTIIFRVRDEADLTHIAPILYISSGATVEPASGVEQDFSIMPKQYTVTSEDKLWQRPYTIAFATSKPQLHFPLEDATLDPISKKYYVWENLCTANAGFAITAGKKSPDEYPTYYCPTGGQSGGYAVLQTISTGSLAEKFGKPLAAGNLFIGKFDATQVLTNTLLATQFGVPIVYKPINFSGYYKYKSGTQMHDKHGNPISGKDSCAIYALLYQNHDEKGNRVVLTGVDVTTSPLIVSWARFSDIPETDTWTPFDIPFVYNEKFSEDLLAKGGYSLAMVCSSSKDGAEFKGAIGSKLCVDELNIDCKYEQK